MPANSPPLPSPRPAARLWTVFGDAVRICRTLCDSIKRNIKPGSLIISDAWQGYSGIEPEIYDHLSVSQAAQKRAGDSPSAVPGVDRVTSNLKTCLRGTHHGAGADHLDAHLDEFVFRFNRRYYPMAGFATLLGLGAVQAPTTGDQILSPPTPERVVRRRGRATGLTSVRFPNPPLDSPAQPALDARSPGETIAPPIRSQGSDDT